jgi:TnpA family transposase
MPVELLSPEQARRYGLFAGDPSPQQLARFFHLDDADRAHIDLRTRDHTRLGFATQLGTVRFLGTFLDDPVAVPANVAAYLAAQLDIPDPACLARYTLRATTAREHAAEIQRIYGYHHFSAQPQHFRPVRWLYTRSWLSAERPIMLFDLATA